MGCKFNVMASPVQKAILAAGGQSALARLIGVSQQAVHKWQHGKARPNGPSVLAIYRATGGAVTPHELRPDLYPDPDWRPALEKDEAA